MLKQILKKYKFENPILKNENEFYTFFEYKKELAKGHCLYFSICIFKKDIEINFCLTLENLETKKTILLKNNFKNFEEIEEEILKTEKIINL